jgi:acetophenone carboxylase
MDDLRTNVISHAVARSVYRVRYDEASLIVDLAATERDRAAARAERKQRGKPFSEFMAEWQALRPSDDKLKYYGDWPEPHAPGYAKAFWGLHD